MRSSEQDTAYLRGGSIGDQSEGRKNKGVGLSHYKKADNIISGSGLGGNEIRISNQEDGSGANSDLPKINIEL